MLLAVACAAPLRARRTASVPTPPPAGYVAAPDQLWPVEVKSRNGMVVCGSPEAAEAGAAILAAGAATRWTRRSPRPLRSAPRSR